jgi:hypothetical protein
MSKRSEQCIFCGAAPCTKEHFFPDWLTREPLLGDLFSRREKNYDQVFSMGKPNGSGGIANQTGELTVDGDPLSRKIRRVCKRCNNGWMGQIESETKPLLIPVILGQTCVLSPDDQLQIATWLTLKLIVAEHIAPGVRAVLTPGGGPAHVVTGESVRAEFRAEPGILPNWRIWIGMRGGRPDWRDFQRSGSGGAIGLSADPADPRRLKTQAALITIGQFVAFIVSSDGPLDFGLTCDMSDYLTEIVPIGDQDIRFGHTVPLPENMARELARSQLQVLPAALKAYESRRHTSTLTATKWLSNLLK